MYLVFSTQPAVNTKGQGILSTPAAGVTWITPEETRVYSDEQIKEFEKLDKFTPGVKKALTKLL